MKRRSFRFLTFIISVLVSGTSLFVMPVSAEEISPVSQNVQYDIDDEDYKAKVDELYGHAPMEDVVLESLNDLVNNYYGDYVTKWFFKHIYVNAPEITADIRKSDSSIADKLPLTAESHFIGEQGRGEDIEQKDGKVRKFTDVTVYWNMMLSKRSYNTETVNDLLREKGYDATAVMSGTNGKKFYLQIKEDIGTDTLLDMAKTLHEKFGFLPQTYGYEKGVYRLYHDPDYTGYNYEDEYEMRKGGDDDSPIVIFNRDEKKLKNSGTFESGVTFGFNPKNRVLIITGEGLVTYEEAESITGTFIGYRPADVIIIGKDVRFETYREHSIRLNDGSAEYKDDRVRAIDQLALGCWNEYLYLYKESYADKAYNLTLERERKRTRERDNGVDYTLRYCVNYVDDSLDPYDVLNGKVVLEPAADKSGYEEWGRQLLKSRNITPPEETTTEPTKPDKTPLKGDADLNGEVSLSDITAIAKYNLSHELYPLANDTAMRNADMNEDGIVNAIDMSVLIERQLGK